MHGPTEPPRPSRALLPALLAVAIAVGLAFLLRRPVGDEEIAHALIARGAPARPDLFLSIVGRPLVTLLLCLPAQFGLVAARVMGALAAGLTVFAVARLFERPGSRLAPAWALPLVFVQPFFLAHAGTAMTEPFAAAALAVGIMGAVERRPMLLIGAAALAPLIRTELAILWPLAVWQLARGGTARGALWLPVPMILWAALGALVAKDPLWLLRQAQWGYYPERDAGHYLRSFGWITGPGLLLPVLLGTFATLIRIRTPRGRSGGSVPADDPLPDRIALLSLLGLLGAYTALAWWLPITYGNLRYLAVAAAPLALLAARGGVELTRPRDRAWWLRVAAALVVGLYVGGHALHNDFVILSSWHPWPGVAALLILAATLPRSGAVWAPLLAAVLAGGAGLGAFYRTSLYWTPSPELDAVATAAAAIPLSTAPGEARRYAAHPALAFHLGKNPYHPADWPPLPETLRSSATSGTLLFWDSHYLAPRGASWSAEAFVTDPNWEFRSGVIAPDSTFAGAWFERRTTSRSEGAPPADATTWLAGVKDVQSGAPRTRRLLASVPDDATAWRSLALQLLAVDRVPEARAAWRRIEALDPGAPENALVAASLQLRLGNPESALAALDQALAVRPQDGELNLVAGRLLVRLDRHREARPRLETAARRLALRWDVQYLVGEFLMQVEDWPAAESRLREAARMNPRSPDAALRLVEVVVRQRRLADARTILEDLIRRQPMLATAYIYLGDLERSQGRTDAARAAYQAGLDRTGDPVCRARLEAPGSGVTPR